MERIFKLPSLSLSLEKSTLLNCPKSLILFSALTGKGGNLPLVYIPSLMNRRIHFLLTFSSLIGDSQVNSVLNFKLNVAGRILAAISRMIKANAKPKEIPIVFNI